MPMYQFAETYKQFQPFGSMLKSHTSHFSAGDIYNEYITIQDLKRYNVLARGRSTVMHHYVHLLNDQHTIIIDSS